MMSPRRAALLHRRHIGRRRLERAGADPSDRRPFAPPCHPSDRGRPQDTYISYKDAMKGDYDDAVANAFWLAASLAPPCGRHAAY